MPHSRRVVLYGNSIALAGIAVNCAKQPGLEIVTIDAGEPAAARRLQDLASDVVIFDLVESRSNLAISLLRERADLLLLGVDPSRNEMLVLSGHLERVSSTQDLLQVVNRQAVAQPGEQKEELLSRRKPGVVHKIFQPKQTQFIEKEKIKMKNMSQRAKIILAIVGIVVIVAIVAVVVFTQVGGGELSGATGLAVTPSNPSIVMGVTIYFYVNSTTPCTWSVTNSAVAKISGSNTGTSAAVIALAPGTTAVKATCSTGSPTTNLTVQSTGTGISPAYATLATGTGTVKYSVVPAASCTWSIANTSIARIGGSNSGPSVLVEGAVPGTTTISAVCGSTTVTTDVMVVAGPTPTPRPTSTPTPTATATPVPLQFTPANPTIQVNQALQVQVNGNNCTFSSSNSGIATVSGLSGTGSGVTTNTIRGVAKGQATITATCGTATTTTTVTVHVLLFTPTNPTIQVNGSLQLQVNGDNCTFSSSNSGIVTVSGLSGTGSGVTTNTIRGVAKGQATITATCGSTSDFTIVTVQ